MIKVLPYDAFEDGSNFWSLRSSSEVLPASIGPGKFAAILKRQLYGFRPLPMSFLRCAHITESKKKF